MTTAPRTSAGLMSWSTWWALSAAKRSASARAATWSPCSTSSRICSPSGVPPGWRVTTTSRPRCSSASVSRRTWVDLPAPSPPSKQTKSPGAVPSRWVAAARFSVTLRPYATVRTVAPTTAGASSPHAPREVGVAGDHASATADQGLGDLDRIEGRTLAQVVADDEEHEALARGSRLVGPHAPDEDLVATGRLERVGHVGDDDARRVLEQVERLLGRDVALELRVDGEAVPGEDGDAHARARDPQVGGVQDLARLVAQLLLLVGLEGAVVDDRPCEGHDVEADGDGIQLRLGHGHRAPVEREPGGVARGIRPLELAVELLDAHAAGAAHGLVARDVQAHEAGLVVKRLEHRHRGHRRAVGVGDDALRDVAEICGVD